MIDYIRSVNETERYAARTRQQQAGYQILGECICIGIALGSGLICGGILRLIGSPENDDLFNDQFHFEIDNKLF